MFTKKEIVWLVIPILLMAFIISFLSEFSIFLYSLLFAFLIIGSSVAAKKIAANYVDIKIEHKIWHFQRYGLYERSYFKTPIPIGLLLPFLVSLMSSGIFKCFTFLQFDYKPKKARVAKKTGLMRFTESTEWHIASIAIWGVLANFILAIIALIAKQPELAKYSVYYIAWNLIPIGELDGTKLFFGSLIAWIILAIITLLLLGVVWII